MARRSRRASPAVAATVTDGRWTPAQAAKYAAQRDFLLCQLLATDRRALAVARQLRFGLPSFAVPTSVVASPPARSGAQGQQPRGADAARAPNHQQRRSAARAARNRAAQAAAAAAAAPAAAPAASVAATAAPPPAAAVAPTAAAASALRSAAAAFVPPAPPPCATAEADVDMAGDRPSSPSSRCEKESRAEREERELLASASAALAWRREFRTYEASDALAARRPRDDRPDDYWGSDDSSGS